MTSKNDEENNEKITNSIQSTFSLRIVVADFYITKPISGLDPVHSEFRGNDVKTVFFFFF